MSRRAFVVLLCALFAACGSSAGPPPVTQPVAVPDLPAGVMLQLFIPSTGELYRVAEDGRFLVTAPGGAERVEQPKSKYERGAQKVSPGGLNRLRAALGEAEFFSLPDELPMNDCVPEGTVIRNSGRKVTGQPIVFSARDGGSEKTVRGKGDLGAPCTLGKLEPVYRALDLEALGDWMGE